MNLLNEREKTHGDFEDVARVAQALKFALAYGPTEELPDVHRESLDMICVKMARIVCGDHNEIDHWRDCIGYAQLVLNHITKDVPPGSASIQEPDDEPLDPSIGDDWDFNPSHRPRSGLLR
jgi:hypothetical protein